MTERVEYFRKWRESHPGYYARLSKAWRDANPAKRRTVKQRWRNDNKEKVSAYLKVQWAIKTGKLIKQPCAVCGNPKSEAHHPDYSKPYDVRWLCHKHHSLQHKKPVP